MAFLTKDKVGEILQNAPVGTTPAGIIAGLRKRGHTLEGFEEAQNLQVPQAPPFTPIAGPRGLTVPGTETQVGQFKPFNKEAIQEGIKNIPIPDPTKTILNAPGNLLRIGGSLLSAVVHPVKTVTELAGGAARLVSGATAATMRKVGFPEDFVNRYTKTASEWYAPKVDGQKVDINVEQQFGQLAQEAGEFFSSSTRIKKFVEENPVDAALVISSLLTGGGGLVSKVGKLTKTEKAIQAGSAISEVGRAIDPITGLAKVTSGGIRKTTEFLNKPSKNFRAEEAAIAAEQGISLPVGALTENRGVRFLDVLSSKGFFGAKIAKKIETALESTRSGLNKISETLKSENLDNFVTGLKAKAGFKKFSEGFHNTITNIYDDFLGKNGNIEVSPNLTIKAIDEFLDRTAGSAVESPARKFLEGVKKKLERGKKVAERGTSADDVVIKGIGEDLIIREQRLSKSLETLSPELESQYAKFKKIRNVDKFEDVSQLKAKTKNADIDNILSSQENTIDEMFDIFKERRANERELIELRKGLRLEQSVFKDEFKKLEASRKRAGTQDGEFGARNIKDMKETRTEFWRQMKAPESPLRTADGATKDRIYAALSQDIENAIIKANPEYKDVFRGINELNAEGVGLINGEVGRAIDNSKPEKLIDTFFKPKNKTNLEDLKKMAGDDAFSNMANVFLTDIIKKSFKEVRGKPFFDPKKFRTLIKNFDDATLKVIFDESQMKNINEALSNIGQVEKVLNAIGDVTKISEGSQTGFINKIARFIQKAAPSAVGTGVTGAALLSNIPIAVLGLVSAIAGDAALAKFMNSNLAKKLFLTGFDLDASKFLRLVDIANKSNITRPVVGAAIIKEKTE